MDRPRWGNGDVGAYLSMICFRDTGPAPGLEAGFGLVDLLVAMLLSLVLMAGVTQVYISSQSANVYSDNLAQLQENARFALDTLSKHIRMAGYMPCRPKKISNLVLPSMQDSDQEEVNLLAPYINLDQPIAGVDQVATATGWYEDAIAGTDALKIIYSGDSGSSYRVVDHMPSSARLDLNRRHPFQKGTFVLVCDPEHAALFQNSRNDGSPYRSLFHGQSGANCTQDLGYPVECSAGTAYTFGPGANVAELESRVFYIGNSAYGGGRSLKQRRLNIADGSETYNILDGNREELVEGVENLQILYGIDSPGDDDKTPDRYVKAGDVSDWGSVVAVKIWIIVSTPEALHGHSDTDSYAIAGESSVPIPDGDNNKYRAVFSTTIQLRNRVL
ncbi:MAG: PilW family protein [Candidatus Sedimenticola sp. 20ELBAFRAG]